MKLTPKNVGDILETTLRYRVMMNPHGFELHTPDQVPRHARLRCGSGIAGRGAIWGLVQMPDGSPIAMGLDTKPRLVRAILEFMAGPPPTNLPEYMVPRARSEVHPRSGAASFVWYRRLRKSLHGLAEEFRR